MTTDQATTTPATPQASTPYAVVTVDRLIPAPVSAVWRAWTDPAVMTRWWGRAEGLTLFRCEMEVRPGGTYRYAMRPAANPDGPVEACHGTFREVVPGERLVFTWSWDNGALRDTLVTVTFTAEGDGTRVRVRHENQPTAEIAANHATGWTHMLADLGAWFGAA